MAVMIMDVVTSERLFYKYSSSSTFQYFTTAKAFNLQRFSLMCVNECHGFRYIQSNESCYLLQCVNPGLFIKSVTGTKDDVLYVLFPLEANHLLARGTVFVIVCFDKKTYKNVWLLASSNFLIAVHLTCLGNKAVHLTQPHIK